ncbi:GRIP and coiled-coil domain-containing protein 2 [Trichinella zimbabwensis]|uniref:GRIP and coiled-coil domain-containing protein 2 n=1 Tax=Trichinella zimbabwensis TaxID=268475 RepID=A0A0V1HU06_9BILA|nr:GRIP and coiled-coil domain-containing protein 2 [Trichinella zimbabwensis]
MSTEKNEFGSSKLDKYTRVQLYEIIKRQAALVRHLKEQKNVSNSDAAVNSSAQLEERQSEEQKITECASVSTLQEQCSHEQQNEVLLRLKDELKLRNFDLEASRIEIAELKSQLNALAVGSESGNEKRLRLEIADYERAIKKFEADLVTLREVHEKKCHDFDDILNEKENLKIRIVESEQSIVKLDEEVEHLKHEHEKLIEESKTYKATAEFAEIARANVAADMEKQKMQLTEEITSANKRLEANQQLTAELQRRNVSLESDLQCLRDELSSTREAFDSYKIKSQAALLKQQQEQKHCQPSNNEEKELLEKQVANLQEKLDKMTCVGIIITLLYQSACTQIRDLNENEKFFKEETRQRFELADATEKSLLEKLNASEKERKRAVAELKAQLENMSKEKDSISQKYDQQLNLQQCEHATQVSELEKKLASLHEEWEKLILDRKKSTSPVLTDRSFSCPRTPPLYERKSGEGSEEIPCFTTGIHISNAVNAQASECSISPTSLIPLDELIDATYIPQQSSFYAINAENGRQAQDENGKNHHLTELLYESESNNTRLEEQIRLLKDEIRRLNRNQEREQHIANAEYLKNVILEFVAPKMPDARQKLIPVLTAMLSLSPSEVAILQKTATLMTLKNSQSAINGPSTNKANEH